ncbi:hypothetical protein ACKWTF_008451 [Chironomus riparius]
MNFNHPVYINFYKFLLIEEIVLADNPATVHYGRCNLIGYLASPDCIQSLTIPNVDREYQLPDGEISLKIHVEFHPREFLHSTVQIYGEVRLIEKNREMTVENFESSHSLIHRLRELQRSLELEEGKDREPSGTNDKSMSLPVRIRLEKEIHTFEDKYMPVIYVDSIRRLPLAREIMLENLNYRLIREKVDSVLKMRR